LTNSFARIRTAWFVLQAALFLSGSIALARWVGGRTGRLAALMLPAFLASVPTMLNFQFGQFHLIAVLLAVLAMVAFEHGRHATGGALLACAAASKVFPALLLVTLAARRGWRDIGWTVLFGVLFAGAGLVVLGYQPFAAFLTYQVPRIVTGAAFAFARRPDVPVFIVARNLSISAVDAKLRVLGVSLPSAAAAGVNGLYMMLLVIAACRAARTAPTRGGRLVVWLALLNLSALRSPVAPSAYAAAPILWMLAWLAGELRGSYRTAAVVAIGWVLIMGLPPLGDTLDVVSGLIGQGSAVAVSLWVVLAYTPGTGMGRRRERAETARAPAPSPTRNQVRFATSIFGSYTSVDESRASQVSAAPEYAALRTSIAVKADSAPCAAWLWNWPLVMLATYAFCFSGSALSSDPANVPEAEN
jgi:hypothetical protein